MSKKILGVEVIKQLGITTAELLKRMKSGRLKATTIDGDKVYDLDGLNVYTAKSKDNGDVDFEKVHEEDTRGPTVEERIAADRRFAIYQLQKRFPSSDNQDPISEFPEGWYGIRFNPPRDDIEREQFYQKIRSFLFEGDDIEKNESPKKPSHNYSLGGRFKTSKAFEKAIKNADHLLYIRDYASRDDQICFGRAITEDWFKSGPAWSTFLRNMQEIQRIGGDKYKDLLPRDRPGSKKKKAR